MGGGCNSGDGTDLLPGDGMGVRVQMGTES